MTSQTTKRDSGRVWWILSCGVGLIALAAAIPNQKQSGLKTLAPPTLDEVQSHLASIGKAPIDHLPWETPDGQNIYEARRALLNVVGPEGYAELLVVESEETCTLIATPNP